VIRLTGEITYQDGRIEAVEASQAAFAAWELYALRLGLPVNPEGAPPITMLRYLGFAATQQAKGQPRRDWPPFEDWDATVTDVNLEGDGETAAGNPTDPGATQVFPQVRSAG
jgi:hypothetical protein